MPSFKTIVPEQISTAPVTTAKFKRGDYIQLITDDVDLNGKRTKGVVARQDSESQWVLINFDDGRKYWLSEKCLEFVDIFLKGKKLK